MCQPSSEINATLTNYIRDNLRVVRITLANFPLPFYGLFGLLERRISYLFDQLVYHGNHFCRVVEVVAVRFFHHLQRERIRVLLRITAANLQQNHSRLAQPCFFSNQIQVRFADVFQKPLPHALHFEISRHKPVQNTPRRAERRPTDAPQFVASSCSFPLSLACVCTDMLKKAVTLRLSL